MSETLWGGDPNEVLYDGDGQRKADEAYERMHNARQSMPKPICTNCLAPVEWSRVDSAWWKFIPGSTTPHTCVTTTDITAGTLRALAAWQEKQR